MVFALNILTLKGMGVRHRGKYSTFSSLGIHISFGRRQTGGKGGIIPGSLLLVCYHQIY